MPAFDRNCLTASIPASAVVNRHRAANLNRVLSERAVDAQLARHAALCGSRAVNDVDERSRRADRDDARVADARAGLDREVNRVVVHGERAHLRAVPPLQVVPLPARAERLAADITLVADEVALDAAHACARNAGGE